MVDAGWDYVKVAPLSHPVHRTRLPISVRMQWGPALGWVNAFCGRRLGEGASNKAYSVNEFSQSIEPSDMHSYRLIMIPKDVPVSWVNPGSTPDQVKNTWCRVPRPPP